MTRLNKFSQFYLSENLLLNFLSVTDFWESIIMCNEELY